MIKQKKFKECVAKFEKENNLKLNIDWEKEVAKEKKKKAIPEDLEKRLNEACEVKNVNFTTNDKSSDEEIVDTCKRIFKYLDDAEKKNKVYYLNLGYLLSILKSRYNSENEFLEYAKEQFNRSKTTLTDYIRFYAVCNQHSILTNCNLSYREIMKNLPEIKEMLVQRVGPSC